MGVGICSLLVGAVCVPVCFVWRGSIGRKNNLISGGGNRLIVRRLSGSFLLAFIHKCFQGIAVLTITANGIE